MRFLAWYARFLLVAIAAQFYAAGLAIFGTVGLAIAGLLLFLSRRADQVPARS